MRRMYQYIGFILIIFGFLSGCVTEKSNKKSEIFIGPNDQVVPILVQGYIMGEEHDDDNSLIHYPLRNVKISISKASGEEGISVSTLSTNRGFFSISPDYIAKNDTQKRSYIAIFEKKGFQTLTKVLYLPSPKASTLNILLKRN